MPRLLRAYARGLDAPRQFPRGPVQVDWNHPVTNGLSFVQIFDVPENYLFSDNGTPGSGNTKDGYSLAPGGPCLSVGAPSYTTNAYTVPRAAGSCVSYQTLSWSPTDGSDHIFYDANTSFFHNRKYLDNNWYNGWISNRVVCAASGTFSAGDTFSTALTWNASGSAFYTKGIQRGTAGAPTTANTAGGVVNYNESNFLPTAGYDGVYYLAFWSRVLSQEEILLLEFDPYCLFRPAEGEMAAMFTAGGGGGGFKPYWAANTNLPVLGTGTY